MNKPNQFSIFNSPIDLAHSYWEKLLQPNDWAIDATCGNGFDTLFLANLIQKGGGIIALDIQEVAIQNTENLLRKHLKTEVINRILLFKQSHEIFPDIALKKPIRLIVYNLGYLPHGNKALTTMTSTTLQSLKKSLSILLPGGAISITCYPGHKEGKKEQKILLNFVTSLNPIAWSVSHHSWENRIHSPSLIIIQKKIANC